jgi:hypothetical protein
MKNKGGGLYSSYTFNAWNAMPKKSIPAHVIVVPDDWVSRDPQMRIHMIAARVGTQYATRDTLNNPIRPELYVRLGIYTCDSDYSCVRYICDSGNS